MRIDHRDHAHARDQFIIELYRTRDEIKQQMHQLCIEFVTGCEKLKAEIAGLREDIEVMRRERLRMAFALEHDDQPTRMQIN